MFLKIVQKSANLMYFFHAKTILQILKHFFENSLVYVFYNWSKVLPKKILSVSHNMPKNKDVFLKISENCPFLKIKGL